VWIVALSRDAAVCQGLAFSYGVQAVQLEKDFGDWSAVAEDWLREHGWPGGVAILVAGPAPQAPAASHRIEFLRVGK
jgi:pyruvate kinase